MKSNKQRKTYNILLLVALTNNQTRHFNILIQKRLHYAVFRILTFYYSFFNTPEPRYAKITISNTFSPQKRYKFIKFDHLYVGWNPRILTILAILRIILGIRPSYTSEDLLKTRPPFQPLGLSPCLSSADSAVSQSW